MLRPLYPQGKSPRYPLYRRLGGPQSRSGRGGEEKNSQPPPGIETSVISYFIKFYINYPNEIENILLNFRVILMNFRQIMTHFFLILVNDLNVRMPHCLMCYFQLQISDDRHTENSGGRCSWKQATWAWTSYIQVVLFWIVTPCSEDGGSKVHRNVGILPQHSPEHHEFPSLSKYQISQHHTAFFSRNKAPEHDVQISIFTVNEIWKALKLILWTKWRPKHHKIISCVPNNANIFNDLRSPYLDPACFSYWKVLLKRVNLVACSINIQNYTNCWGYVASNDTEGGMIYEFWTGRYVVKDELTYFKVLANHWSRETEVGHYKPQWGQ
jgi:hypothetical protein